MNAIPRRWRPKGGKPVVLGFDSLEQWQLKRTSSQAKIYEVDENSILFGLSSSICCSFDCRLFLVVNSLPLSIRLVLSLYLSVCDGRKQRRQDGKKDAIEGRKVGRTETYEDRKKTRSNNVRLDCS